MAAQPDVTQLLRAYSAGDRAAGDQLFTQVYDALLALAHRQLAYRRPVRAFGTVELVHEVYLKLIQQEQASWQDRAHFFAVAARAMRHILVDHARRERAQKRGGGNHCTTLDISVLRLDHTSVEILDLEEALTHLAALNPRLSRVVELRFFAGLSIEETAAVLGVSARTIDRAWFKARAFLYRFLFERETL